MKTVMEILGIQHGSWKQYLGEEYESIVWTGDPKCTKEEWEQAKVERDALRPPARLRKERNHKLHETDWWAVSDRKMTQAQIDYRQALRDLPVSQEEKSAFNEFEVLIGVTWPEPPEDTHWNKPE